MHRVDVTIMGVTPMLHNRMPDGVLERMRDKDKPKYVAAGD